MKIPRELIAKYNTQLPRYTSYPPANYFTEGLKTKEYSDLIQRSNEQDPQNISLYIHIPFCNKICHYCGCNSMKIRNDKFTDDYIEAIKTELKMFGEQLSPNRKVSQVHWGGGTPNSLSSDKIREIMDQIISDFSFIENPEIAMECNPAGLNEDYIKDIHNSGFNRISLGIQDFRTDVLKTSNREIPDISIADIVTWLREKKDMKINLDFIYGLPFQSKESFKETIQKAIEINPDRLVTFSYAHVPWVKPAQKKLEKFGLPGSEEKLNMFETASDMLIKAGYRSIGLDHFAKPEDELYQALQNRVLHRNFQGYCTTETTGQVYAAGVSSISQLSEAYVQNTKNINEYVRNLKEGSFAQEKFYILNEHEKIIGAIINDLMCNLYVDLEKIARQNGISLPELERIVSYDKNVMAEFVKDDLIKWDEKKLEITGKGKFFLRNIASSFDPMSGDTNKKFSKTI